MIKYTSKKKFRESLDALCKSTFSWSWVNFDKKIVYFGATDTNEFSDSQLILGLHWEKNLKGRKNPNYAEALHHISLIENNNYSLFTFRQFEELDDPETGRVRIVNFEQDLEERVLQKRSDGWYAILPNDYDGSISDSGGRSELVYLEGSRVPISATKIERNKRAREACIQIHGLACAICKFDFEKVYGELGLGFIHVHHKNPISESDGERIVNPKTDLVPLCPNCHAMVHRNNKNRKIEDVQQLVDVIAS